MKATCRLALPIDHGLSILSDQPDIDVDRKQEIFDFYDCKYSNIEDVLDSDELDNIIKAKIPYDWHVDTLGDHHTPRSVHLRYTEDGTPFNKTIRSSKRVISFDDLVNYVNSNTLSEFIDNRKSYLEIPSLHEKLNLKKYTGFTAC